MKELLTEYPLFVLISSLLVTGFLGSWHCGLMCGPMACYLAAQKQLFHYQMGRLLSYVVAGAFAGQVSAWLLNSHDWLKYVSVALICTLLVMQFFSKKMTPYVPKSLTNFYFKNRNSGFALGFLSFLLPCGWLYTFLVSALAAGSAHGGALVMLIFWLSTLPALTTAQLILKKMVLATNVKTQKISTTILVAAGIYNILTFLFIHH